MLHRSYDVGELEHIASQNPIYFGDSFVCSEWLDDENNVMLSDGKNIALFEATKVKSVALGHYFFSSRGKQALEKGKQFIDFLFDNSRFTIIQGLTPVFNKPARWMSRQLGFQSIAIINTPNGECELFHKTKGK